MSIARDDTETISAEELLDAWIVDAIDRLADRVGDDGDAEYHDEREGVSCDVSWMRKTLHEALRMMNPHLQDATLNNDDLVAVVARARARLRRLHRVNERDRESLFDQFDLNARRDAIDAVNGYMCVERYADLLNRSAVKLAEIDREHRLFETGRMLLFADVCCAPGGFLDYACLRKRWSMRGYGITLSTRDGGLPMAVGNIRATLEPETPVYFLDITRDTAGRLPRVDLVLADGATTDSNVRQTFRSTLRLLTAEWRIAKTILRRGGTLLIKTFNWYDVGKDDTCDDYTLLSVETLLGDMIPRFESWTVSKPPHSRRTNDERYILLRNFAGRVGEQRRHLDIVERATLTLTELYLLLRQRYAYGRIRETLTRSNGNGRSLSIAKRRDEIMTRNVAYARDILNLPLRDDVEWTTNGGMPYRE